MTRRTLAAALSLVLALGAVALAVPTPALADANCVACPAIFIDCGPCGVLHPQTCKRCQYCTAIPNCTP
jgi:hypothetical protein